MELGEVALVRRQVGDGFRLSDGLLGDESFVVRVLAEGLSVDTTLASRHRELRHGAMGQTEAAGGLGGGARSARRDVVEVELGPRLHADTNAKRVLTLLWVREYEGKQIDVARLLAISTAAVSKLHSTAVRDAATYAVQGSAVASLLASRLRRQRASGSKGAQVSRGKSIRPGADRVRHHVTVEED